MRAKWARIAAATVGTSAPLDLAGGIQRAALTRLKGGAQHRAPSWACHRMKKNEHDCCPLSPYSQIGIEPNGKFLKQLVSVLRTVAGPSCPWLGPWLGPCPWLGPAAPYPDDLSSGLRQALRQGACVRLGPSLGPSLEQEHALDQQARNIAGNEGGWAFRRVRPSNDCRQLLCLSQNE